MMNLLEKDEIEWLIQDRILLKNEKVIAKDRKNSNLPCLKIGDGQHRYSELSYIANESNYNKTMTNREWLESLTDNQLAAFLSYGLIGYTCSNCKTKVEEYTNYCAYCGAHMEVRDKL